MEKNINENKNTYVVIDKIAAGETIQIGIETLVRKNVDVQNSNIRVMVEQNKEKILF